MKNARSQSAPTVRPFEFFRRLLGGELGSGLQIGHYKRMRFSTLGNDLRHEQSRNKERMPRQFNHSRCSVFVVTGDPQLLASDLIAESFVQAVIARKDFRCLVGSVNPVCPAARNNSDLSFLSHKRATEFADQFQGCIWRGLFMIRFREPQNIARILYQSMLKSASRSNERHTFFSSKANRAQSPFHAAIGAARSTPNCVAFG